MTIAWALNVEYNQIVTINLEFNPIVIVILENLVSQFFTFPTKACHTYSNQFWWWVMKGPVSRSNTSSELSNPSSLWAGDCSRIKLGFPRFQIELECVRLEWWRWHLNRIVVLTVSKRNAVEDPKHYKPVVQSIPRRKWFSRRRSQRNANWRELTRDRYVNFRSHH